GKVVPIAARDTRDRYEQKSTGNFRPELLRTRPGRDVAFCVLACLDRGCHSCLLEGVLPRPFSLRPRRNPGNRQIPCRCIARFCAARLAAILWRARVWRVGERARQRLAAKRW